jgi:predicted dehydrogenase
MKGRTSSFLFAFFLLASLRPAAQAQEPPLRLGIVGYEGHGRLFTEELNGGLGAKIGLVVTQVWHREPIPQEEKEKYGFAVVPSPEAMIGKVDGVFIAETLPFRYPELAAPFIRAGVRTFLNRPLAASAEAAAGLIKLGRDAGNPILAASALAVDPRVLEIRKARAEFAPLKIVNVTGPSDHFWNYVPHLISALVGVLGPGIEEVQAHDLSLEPGGITVRNPLVVFFRYGADSEAGPVRGTLQMVSGGQPGDWYGFRIKLFGRKESPDYELFQTPDGESAWLPLYRVLIDFFKQGKRPLSDPELLEVPLVLDMIKKSGQERRPVFRSEYKAALSLLGSGAR